jgi:hypothetical protein
MRWFHVTLGAVLAVAACGPSTGSSGGGGPSSTTGEGSSETDEPDDGLKFDLGPPANDHCFAGGGGICRIDLLVVGGLGPSMAHEERNVARNLLGLLGQLRERAEGWDVEEMDLHVLVTSDMVGTNPACGAPSLPGGEPVVSNCRARMGGFADPMACTGACPNPDAGFTRSFLSVQLLAGEHDAKDVATVDIDGDGHGEDAAEQAVACVAALGSGGCPFGEPLEAMVRALDPDAPWNAGDDPFRREDAALGILLIGDGFDCSATGPEVFADATLWNEDPATGEPAPSPALCWNAGTICEGPDGDGVYSDCVLQNDLGLHPTERFVSRLQEIVGEQRLGMAVLGGVPPVTEHNINPPYEPIQGGLNDLSIRTWRDGPPPNGDILPEDGAAGITAADQEWTFGVGPGCTVVIDDEVYGQALPPLRAVEVCKSLDIQERLPWPDGGGPPPNPIRCCVDPICDPQHQWGYRCLVHTLVPIIFE